MQLKISFSLLATLASLTTSSQSPLNGASKPNILFIITDDQDLHMNSLDYMPLLKKHITSQGTFFKRHYCSTALCCPSRVSLWTGRNAHNTNVTDVFPPYGGYPKFVSEGWNTNYLPTWLQASGYHTAYVGKLFNSHSLSNYDSPFPRSPGAGHRIPSSSTLTRIREYSTDVIAEKAYGLLDEAVESKQPFFLVAAPIGPHANVNPPTSLKDGLAGVIFDAPIPAERHKHLFPDAKVPRGVNFNPDHPSGAGWVRRLARLNETVVEYNDHFHRRRLQALQSVDELVAGLITRLDNHGVLDNTYIFYTSDNGFHISQHRLAPGKTCGFEEDINIPLIVRGPGVPKGVERDGAVSAHTDLAPTILSLAGAETGWEGLDGAAVDLISSSSHSSSSSASKSEHVNVEFWGIGMSEGNYEFSLDDGQFVRFGPNNNTYKALRLHSAHYNLYYSVWCTNEHELYDLDADPGQIRNLYPSLTTTERQRGPFTSSRLDINRLIPRLDALLLVTKSCKAETCRDPWSVIHPQRNVHSLSQALDSRFDGFYLSISREERVGFSECRLGYVEESEGAQEAVVYRAEEWEGDGEL